MMSSSLSRAMTSSAICVLSRSRSACGSFAVAPRLAASRSRDSGVLTPASTHGSSSAIVLLDSPAP
jgi:hypothetical protein